MCKIGTRRAGDRWMGVIRVNGKIVWECGHNHKNRDQSTVSSGQSASACARAAHAAATNTEYGKWADAMGYSSMTRGPSPQAIAIVQRAREAAPAVRAALHIRLLICYFGLSNNGTRQWQP